MGNVEDICVKYKITRGATIGNHDIRVMANLAAKVPEWAGMPNTTLFEHFPTWNLSWSVTINSNILVKHRWGGGQYAPAGNAIKSGKTCVTGHLHRGRLFFQFVTQQVLVGELTMVVSQISIQRHSVRG